ncbi:hypothetical protein Patl1_19419 [Pistacia atlantica]|uniref:Uncharacterized protein n=1 Tax=Pistacia atlantica TaxID=434234 RepID=A0ACC1C0X6_9ROSI|nr:hypothetical protein Patl1_19419 [Pistacia atlantica]
MWMHYFQYLRRILLFWSTLMRKHF